MEYFRNLQHSTVFCLENLVSCREKRILSRRICESDALRMVVFAFDRGEEITKETTPSAEVFCLLDGHMEASLGGRPATLLPGMALAAPPEEEHSLLALESCKMLQISLKTPMGQGGEGEDMEAYIQHLPRGEAFSLAGMIEYEENQVASLTLVKKPDLIITLFSLYKGEEIGGHSSTGDALVQVLDGQAEIRIGGELHLVSAGQSILMPANVPHALAAKESFKMLLTVVKPAG